MLSIFFLQTKCCCVFNKNLQNRYIPHSHNSDECVVARPTQHHYELHSYGLSPAFCLDSSSGRGVSRRMTRTRQLDKCLSCKFRRECDPGVRRSGVARFFYTPHAVGVRTNEERLSVFPSVQDARLAAATPEATFLHLFPRCARIEKHG